MLSSITRRALHEKLRGQGLRSPLRECIQKMYQVCNMRDCTSCFHERVSPRTAVMTIRVASRQHKTPGWYPLHVTFSPRCDVLQRRTKFGTTKRVQLLIDMTTVFFISLHGHKQDNNSVYLSTSAFAPDTHSLLGFAALHRETKRLLGRHFTAALKHSHLSPISAKIPKPFEILRLRRCMQRVDDGLR